MIELRNISKSFGDNHVLRDVSLQVETGQSLAIIGGSGTGKSVTLKCVLGLIAPDSGEILLDGAPILAEREAFYRYTERQTWEVLPLGVPTRLWLPGTPQTRRTGSLPD